MRSLAALALLAATACSTASDGDGGVVSALDFCVRRETLTCRRECMTGRYSTAVCEDACLPAGIERTCAGFAWGPTCRPTPAIVDRCYEALEAVEDFAVPAHEFGSVCGSEAICS